MLLAGSTRQLDHEGDLVEHLRQGAGQQGKEKGLGW